MKNLFDAGTVAEIRKRVQQLGLFSKAQWGRMNVAQALAHCSGVLELAVGERRPPRKAIGRILGPVLKRLVVRSEAPLRRNSPTLEEVVVLDQRDLDTERTRLLALLDRFATGGPERCTTHPHPFFGRMSPREWGAFEYKHLDHHLRQFGG